MNDFTTTLVVDQSPHDVYDAILNVRAWWTDDIDGSTDQLGAEFTFRGEDVHRSQIKVTELVAGERVAWLVVDNYMNFVQDQSEWKNTRITFEVSSHENGTHLQFSHRGLVPAYECFDVCSTAWTFFIQDSLRSLITTGVGRPMAKAAAR